MLLHILNLLFVLVAIAMIALILMQRGAGASAGSGFGGGASATVFGARGSANFLSKATKWLAVAFFGITLFMAWYAGHRARPDVSQDDPMLGILSQVPSVPVDLSPVPAPPAVPETTNVPPAAPTSNLPAIPEQSPSVEQ